MCRGMRERKARTWVRSELESFVLCTKNDFYQSKVVWRSRRPWELILFGPSSLSRCLSFILPRRQSNRENEILHHYTQNMTLLLTERFCPPSHMPHLPVMSAAQQITPTIFDFSFSVTSGASAAAVKPCELIPEILHLYLNLSNT